MTAPPRATALAVDRAIRRRAAAEVIAVSGGLVVRHPALWDVHYLNALLLGIGAGDPPGPAAIVDLADRWLGDLAHRHIVFDDADAGERAAAELTDSGWERRRVVFMARAAGHPATPADPRAREITAAEMDALQLTALREEVPEAAVRAGLPERLAATQQALRAGTPARCFGAGDDERPQSMCTLFLDPDVGGRRVAMIEEVATLVAHRGRGLARAAVSAAVAAAGDWGAELIVVPADADDWPQLMYARMGFAPVARQVSLTLRVRPARGAPGFRGPGL